MTIQTIVVLEGDQTGQELLEEALRVLDPAVTRLDVALQRFDSSLEMCTRLLRRLRSSGTPWLSGSGAEALMAHNLLLTV